MRDLEEIEQTRTIPAFPGYEVTNFGRVFNRETGREMVLSPTIHGDLTVGLHRDHKQYRRSVKVLVANAFCYGYSELFGTPIQLDGNLRNLHASNIVWRPRWFAWLYSRQFYEIPEWVYDRPVVDITNKIEYTNIYEAAITRGQLFNDIRRSIFNGDTVFPTGEEYIYKLV